MKFLTPFSINRFWIRGAGLAIIAGLALAGCAGQSPANLTQTPWPTLAPLGTMLAVAGGGDGAQRTGPQLVQHFKVDLTQDGAAVFPLPGQTKRPIRIEVIILSGTLDPFLNIQNGAGDVLAKADRGGVGEPEVIGQFQFAKDGYYQLVVGAKTGAGELGVSIYELDSSLTDGGGIISAIPQQVNGTLRQPASYQTYGLPLQRGKRVDITARALSESLGVQFDLYDPDGLLLDTRDNSDGQDAALWNFMPRFTGQYTVVVSNLDEHIGDYLLKVDQSTSGGPAVLNQRATLNLGGKFDKSIWLTFDSQAFDGVYVEARPKNDTADPVIKIFDPFGNQIVSGDVSGPGDVEKLELVQFPFDGTYQVEFSSKGDSGAIDYLIRSVRLVDAGMGGQIYPGGRAEKGEITGAGSLVCYYFEENKGDLIGVDAHGTGGTGLDLAFDLYGPDGTRLLTRDDVVGKDPILDRYEIPQPGRYVLCLWNFQSTIGPYEIYVTRPEAPATPPPN